MLGGPGVGSDRRGASEVLGAIFVFAILIAAVGVFQVTIVPQTNEEIEFKHSTAVRADVAGLRGAMVSTGTDGGRRTVSVRTGVDYPSRSVTVNPPAPRGRLSTSGEITGAIELQNVVATDPEAGDYWNGTATFDTKFVAYHPSYNYYRGAPVTRYEPTVVYSSFADADVVETRQSLVDGRTLDVVLVSGSLSKSGGASTSVDVAPISTAGGTVTVEDPGPLRVETHLSKERWQDVLGDEPNASVASYTVNADAPNVVEISLASGEWDLRVSKVGLGSGGSPGPAYLTAQGSTSRTVTAGESVDYTVRALDAYGNPVSGVTVKQAGGPNATTDSDGRVTFERTVGTDTTNPVWFGSKPADGGSPRRVDFSFDIVAGGAGAGGGTGSAINPGDGLALKRVTLIDGNLTGAFENVGSDSVTVVALRYNFYNPDTQSSSPVDVPEALDTNRTSSRADMAGSSVSTGDITIAPGARFGVEFRPIDEGSQFEVDDADFLVVTLYFSDGTSSVYFFGAEYDTA
jgi:hypothetical protein